MSSAFESNNSLGCTFLSFWNTYNIAQELQQFNYLFLNGYFQCWNDFQWMKKVLLYFNNDIFLKQDFYQLKLCGLKAYSRSLNKIYIPIRNRKKSGSTDSLISHELNTTVHLPVSIFEITCSQSFRVFQ